MHEVCKQLLTGFKTGMIATGEENMDDLRKFGKFVKISASGMYENHPSVDNVIRESANYSFKR